jgi:hypothetical protein
MVSLAFRSTVATHPNRIVPLLASVVPLNHTASVNASYCTTPVKSDDERDASQSGGFCRVCTNFRDLFQARLKFVDKLIEDSVTPQVHKIRGALSDGTINFDFSECTLQVMVDLRHRFPIQHSIENTHMPRKAVDTMRLALRIYLAEEAADFYGTSLFDICLPILRLLEETTSYIEEYRSKLSEKDFLLHPEWTVRRPISDRKIFSHNDEEEKSATTVEYQAVPNTLGATPKQICELIAPREGLLRVVHCEAVMRSNSLTAFEDKKAIMREQLNRFSLSTLARSVPSGHWRGHGSTQSQKQEIIEYLLTPRITFHGTQKETVRSIVRHGFLKPGDVHPGTGITLPVRCGSTYGRGIYSSPSPSFALSYTSWAAKTTASDIAGMKLIVCATVMGRASAVFRGDNWRDLSQPREGADSHVGNCEQEYIVFDSAQILPCYVVHLDWGEQPSRTLDQVQSLAAKIKNGPKTALSQMAPGDLQRHKEERMAKARKFFAYGFGPVSGNKVIIEDIASDDDDEEDYGEYQGSRVDVDAQEQHSFWDWQPKTMLGKQAVDQYTKARFEE